jgi:oxygen-dependent protoporphyrinogen oxidase
LKRVIIIGGGVAGLGAAVQVKQAADQGHEVEFVLIDKDERVGGKVATQLVEDRWGGAAGANFVVDGGPDCFLGEKPAVHRISKVVGIFDEELPTDDSRKKTLILSRGGLYEMPDGIMMFAPTKFMPFATTGLFSWPGKFRMAMDLLIPRKRLAPGEFNDETLESFVVRRMGRECLDRLAEPLVGGVHASDPTTMSLAATFPRLLEMEQKYGSLMRGFLASRKAVERAKKANPPKPGVKPRTFFISFERGMASLAEGMADFAGRSSIRLGTGAIAVSRVDGGSWSVQLADGSSVEGDAVIVATEVWAAEKLLRGVDSQIADALGGIPASSSATVSIAFREDEIGIDTNAFGVLCPLAEKRALMATTFSSTKWPGRAPQGKVLMRAFLGGPHNQAIMARSDEELGEIALTEMRDILGVKGEPLFTKVFRWNLGMPQYTIGHLGRVELIESHCADTPGLSVAGGGYRGVGVPNSIESGERAAVKVLADLGIEAV